MPVQRKTTSSTSALTMTSSDDSRVASATGTWYTRPVWRRAFPYDGVSRDVAAGIQPPVLAPGGP